MVLISSHPLMINRYRHQEPETTCSLSGPPQQFLRVRTRDKGQRQSHIDSTLTIERKDYSRVLNEYDDDTLVWNSSWPNETPSMTHTFFHHIQYQRPELLGRKLNTRHEYTSIWIQTSRHPTTVYSDSSSLAPISNHRLFGPSKMSWQHP